MPRDTRNYLNVLSIALVNESIVTAGLPWGVACPLCIGKPAIGLVRVLQMGVGLEID